MRAWRFDFSFSVWLRLRLLLAGQRKMIFENYHAPSVSSSVRLPKVALTRPPTESPVRLATDSVARLSSAASGVIASTDRTLRDLSCAIDPANTTRATEMSVSGVTDALQCNAISRKPAAVSCRMRSQVRAASCECVTRMPAAVLTIVAFFAILFVWQLPHFFAIGWRHRADYARAGVKILPVVDPSGRRTARLAAAAALAPGCCGLCRRGRGTGRSGSTQAPCRHRPGDLSARAADA